MRLALIAVVFVAGCAYVVLQLVGLRQSLDSERRSQAADSAAIAQLSNALNTTRSQLQQHGVTPKVPPPTEIIQGLAGATGAQGPQGIPGKDAPTPNPTVIASIAAGMVHPSPGPSGPPGPQGQPGANSTVPGPQGQPGKDGQPGQPPAGWTTKNPDGSTTTCQRVANFDPNNPWYTCTTSAPPSPSPTPTGPSQNQAVTSTSQAQSKPRQSAHSTGPR